MSLVIIEDLNGDHYLGLQEGETLERHSDNVYMFLSSTPMPQNPLDRVDFTEDQASDFLRINFAKLKKYVLNGTDKYTDQQAAIISYHRLLAVQEGLVSPVFVPGNFHVDYAEVKIVDTKDPVPKDNDDKIKAVLTVDVQETISETFSDRIALVAFVFRARGHHYTKEYQDLYARVYERCRYKLSDLHISFEHLATTALHAVYPVILDKFWQDGVENGHVNGSLSKRFDVACAGCAGPVVLRQGIEDLAMVAPGIRDRLAEAVHYLDGVLNELKEHRFAGSVNARYYGVKKVRFDEKRVGAIAATIFAALQNLTEDAPLGKSPALKRIADNAPITGAVLGRAIGNVANRPEVVNSLMIEHAPR